MTSCLVVSGSCFRPTSSPLAPAPSRDAGVRLFDAGTDAGPPPRPMLVVHDANGTPREPDAMSRTPSLTLSAPLDVARAAEAVFMIHGRADEPLLADFEALPLRSETTQRLVAMQVSPGADGVTLTPRGTLEAGTEYTVLIAAWAKDGANRRWLDSPLSFALRTRTGPSAGARAVAAWPPHGATGVPAALAWAAIATDGALDPMHVVAELRGTHGTVRAAVRMAACTDLGWPPGDCVVVVPSEPLEPAEAYETILESATRDATGGPLEAMSARFTTAPFGASEELTPRTLGCGIDEQTTDAGCVAADDRTFWLRTRWSTSARLFLQNGASSDATVAPRGEATLRAFIGEPSTERTILLRAFDFLDLARDVRFTMPTASEMPTVTITEARINPRGPEPRQEYVEVLNFGPSPVDLFGISLSDKLDQVGDVVTDHVSLHPGERALLVPLAFDSESDVDDAVPPGVALVRLDASLGAGGIANGGETLYLRDAGARRLALVPALAAPIGGCIVRTSVDPRDARPQAFSSSERCTPGERSPSEPP